MIRALPILAVSYAAFSFIVPLVASLPVAAQTQPQEPAAARPNEETRQKVFNAEQFTLDNGMEVVVIPNTRAPVVTHMVWYKVGAALEPAGKSGIAHFLEHLMFKGSAQIGGPDLAPGEFSKVIRGMGGKDNAFTSQDYTAYFQSVPADKLETVMRMEAGRMRGMSLPEDEVLAERKVIMEERRQRTDNDPQARFAEQVRAHAFINHPYGDPIIGWMHEIEKLGPQDARDYYTKWYAPNNAILVVSGDVSPGEVFSLAIKIYGSIAKQDLPERRFESSPPAEGSVVMEMKDAALKEPMIYALYRAPSARQDKKAALALSVLAEIMGGGPTSRLYQALVVDQKLASSAGLSYDATQWDDADLTVYAVPLPGQDMDKLNAALFAELRRLAQKGISEDELNDAVTRMKDSAIYARDSLSGPAMVIGRALASGLTLDDVEYWPYDVSHVTREDVQEAAKLYLNPDAPLARKPVVGILTPLESEGE